MDQKVSLSAMLASVAGGDTSMILANGNSPLGQTFGMQQADSSTHNHHVTTPFFLNPQQLSVALAAANFKFVDTQFSATSPPNNFIAASPLSSISSSLSSAATDASPTSFASLSGLSPQNLQHLSKLISPNFDVGPATTSNADHSAEVFQTLRGVIAAATNTNHQSNVNSPVAYSPMISTASVSPSYSLPNNNNDSYEQQDGPANGPRRIRRRRPKSPKLPAAKKANTTIVEVKKEEPQQMIKNDEAAITLENSPMDSSMTSGASDSFNSNDELSGDGQLSASQKICRVCGDHATGYNFNVISCESCKAFFRRNALRPKDFKCPYSGDCEINAVSRRFCQLCRLQKCVKVGMKKEWILNDEQLKRRKNSRLNSLKSVNSNASNEPLSPLQFSAQLPPLQHRTPLSTSTPQPNPIQPLIPSRSQSFEEAAVKREPTEHQFLTQLATCQQNSIQQQQNSAFVSTGFTTNQYSDNSVALQQIINAANAASQQKKSSNFMPILSQYNRVTMNPLLSNLGSMNQQFVEKPVQQSNFESIIQQPLMNTHIPIRPSLQQMQNLSMEDYNQMVQTTQANQSHFQTTSFNFLPTSLQSNFTELPVSVESSVVPTVFVEQQNGAQDMESPSTDSPQQSSSQLSSPNANFTLPPFFDLSPATILLMEEAIQDEFEAYSPKEFSSDAPNQIDFKETTYGDKKTNYQLNSSELCELDVVRNAFTCMEEPLNDSKDTETLKKREHNATDVMNIIDIIMRRFVKMTKKLPAFNQMSQEGKLVLLKSAMIKMVTMRGVTRFDPKKLCWSTSLAGRSNVNVSCHIFEQLNDTCQKSNFLRFCYNIHDAIRKNDVIINLIGLLILFGNTNNIKDEKDKAKAQEFHLLYSNLLRRYIESIHGIQAEPIVASIPVILKDLNNLGSFVDTVFVGKVKSSGDTKKLPLEFFKTDDTPTTQSSA